MLPTQAIPLDFISMFEHKKATLTRVFFLLRNCGSYSKKAVSIFEHQMTVPLELQCNYLVSTSLQENRTDTPMLRNTTLFSKAFQYP